MGVRKFLRMNNNEQVFKTHLEEVTKETTQIGS